MRAMVFEGVDPALRSVERPEPIPGPGEIRVRVRACGICRTDLHIIDGDLTQPKIARRIHGPVEMHGEIVRESHEPDRDGSRSH